MHVVPFVTKEITRPPAPWFNEEIRQTIANKNKILSMLKNDRSNIQLQNDFKDQKKLVKSCITTSKYDYYLPYFSAYKTLHPIGRTPIYLRIYLEKKFVLLALLTRD